MNAPLHLSINVFEDDFGGFSARTSMSQNLRTRRLLRSPVPLFASFFSGDHKNTDRHQTYSYYTNGDADWQGQIFEEITGKPNGEYILAEVSAHFGGIVPSFFVENVLHDKLLSLGSVGESSGELPGATTI